MQIAGWRKVGFVAAALLVAGSAWAASAPVFTVQPESQTVAVNTTVTFNSIATGVPTPTYQWRKDGANIASAIGSSLTLPLVQVADAGTYTVVATNSAGTVTSTGAVLGIFTAPTITTQPQSQTVTAGASVSLSVVAAGTPAPTYQWRKGSVNIPAPAGTAGTLTLANVQVADAGSYTVVATNPSGSVTSNAAVLTVNEVAPTIVTSPVAHTMATGSTVIFEAQATGNIVSAQWKKDGIAFAGGTATRLVLANVQPGDEGSYTVTLTNTAGSATSSAATLTVVASDNPGRIANLSIRGTSGAGNRVLIMGFVTGGDGTSGTTPVLIRGVGPSIVPAPYSVTDALPDPVIQVIADSTIVAANDDWAGDAAVKAAATATGAFTLISDTSKDAALLHNLPGRVYSVVVSDGTGTTGTVLAEIYDAGVPLGYNPVTPRLVNISARAYVSASSTLIAGFVVAGQTAKTVLIRVIGPNPAFAAAVGSEALADPQLSLYRSQDGISAAVQTNDNWGGDMQFASVGQRVGADPLTVPTSKDAAILLTLDPGVYSAVAYGANGAAGITLVEVYDVP